MKREEFLSQPEVESFVAWLATSLPTLTFRLRFKSSRFVPCGLELDVQGFESILQHYRWKADWRDASGCSVTSQTWMETQHSLGKLRVWLASAVNCGDDQQALEASLEILRWGGVRGAIPFLHRKAKRGQLSVYLRVMAVRMALDGSNDLSDLNSANVERFDAGLTKIHALLDLSGSPIYDSRVGAAIAMLYSLFCQEEGIAKGMLVFPSGDARGNQIRNPKAFLNGRPAPLFSAVSYADWARCQVRLGWIIRSVLERTSWFAEQGALPERCHAFEACLFMIGYDLRCFGIPLRSPSLETTASNRMRKKTGHGRGWVPTGHPFSRVIRDYLAFRQSGQPDDKKTFVTWMMEHGGNGKLLKRSTAQGYCFAFTMDEFDLFGRSVDDLNHIVSGGESGLCTALAITEIQPFTLGDEREKVCLVDVFIAGNAYSFASAEKERIQYVLEAGYANTENAAKTLLALGRNVGTHFGLLDDKHLPTPLFDQFYCDFSFDS
tara:strand:+ start:7374 stop:8852 length:1479 start_codon:yes stop_codon:yes gene_type:complete